jgi:hypothetical protein
MAKHILNIFVISAEPHYCIFFMKALGNELSTFMQIIESIPICHIKTYMVDCLGTSMM